MPKTPRLLTLGVFGLLVLLPYQAFAQNTEKQAGVKFRKSCVDCHTVPDRKFATDKAWLIRIKDTA